MSKRLSLEGGTCYLKVLCYQVFPSGISENKIMLYQTNQDLPLEIRTGFSETTQDLYRAAYNCAIHWYGDTAKAHKVALSAVRMHSARTMSVLV
jgi:cation transport regulator